MAEEKNKKDESVQYVAKFVNKPNKKFPLWFAISLDNERLQGARLKAFFSLVNDNKQYITKLFVVTSAEIFANYSDLQTAEKLASNWLEQAKEYGLNKEFLAVQFEVIKWSKITSTPEYQKTYTTILNDYRLDEIFKSKVDTLAELFVQRKGVKFEHAKNYLLCEAAVMLMFDAPITYPSKKFNTVVQYALDKHLQTGAMFLGYTLSKVKPPTLAQKVEELEKIIGIQNEMMKLLLQNQVRILSQLSHSGNKQNTFFGNPPGEGIHHNANEGDMQIHRK